MYNRIPAKVGHDLGKALSLTEKLPFEIKLSIRSRKFISHLSEVGEYRYIDVPFHVNGYVLIDLDLAVWEIRRYCQVLKVLDKQLPIDEQKRLDQANSDLENSENTPRHKFRLHGGFLEKITDDKKHPSRSALLWQNPCFGTRNRTKVKAMNHFSMQNPLLYLYPEMLDELLKYVHISKDLKPVYQQHLQNIQSGAKTRP